MFSVVPKGAPVESERTNSAGPLATTVFVIGRTVAEAGKVIVVPAGGAALSVTRKTRPFVWLVSATGVTPKAVRKPSWTEIVAGLPVMAPDTELIVCVALTLTDAIP